MIMMGCRISNADIKDKTSLLDARKSVEREMERFKVFEKEAKMKAFSKAALGQAEKLDPREAAKGEAREWINNTVDSINAQVGGGRGWRQQSSRRGTYRPGLPFLMGEMCIRAAQRT